MSQHGQLCLLLIFLNSVFTACGGDNGKKKATIFTKMRTTGAPSDLTAGLASYLRYSHDLKAAKLVATLTAAEMTANSEVTLETFKVPVSRIALVNGLSGTSYSGTSPYLYECPHTADKDCLVDLTEKISIDNLLKGAADKELEFEEDETYQGVAVEFCHQHESYYEAIIKAEVILNDVAYYTNAADGLSVEGPAENVKIKFSGGGCGVTTKLVKEIQISEDNDLDLILYAEPSGAVFATDDDDLANSSCKGDTGLSICTDPVAVFGTIDKARALVERYLLQTEGNYNDMLLTVLFNSEDEPFGGYLRNYYRDESETKALHSSFDFMSITENSNRTLTFESMNSAGKKLTVIKSFERDDHDNRILKLVDETISFSAVKL